MVTVRDYFWCSPPGLCEPKGRLNPLYSTSFERYIIYLPVAIWLPILSFGFPHYICKKAWGPTIYQTASCCAKEDFWCMDLSLWKFSTKFKKCRLFCRSPWRNLSLEKKMPKNTCTLHLGVTSRSISNRPSFLNFGMELQSYHWLVFGFCLKHLWTLWVRNHHQSVTKGQIILQSLVYVSLKSLYAPVVTLMSFLLFSFLHKMAKNSIDE